MITWKWHRKFRMKALVGQAIGMYVFWYVYRIKGSSTAEWENEMGSRAESSAHKFVVNPDYYMSLRLIEHWWSHSVHLNITKYISQRIICTPKCRRMNITVLSLLCSACRMRYVAVGACAIPFLFHLFCYHHYFSCQCVKCCCLFALARPSPCFDVYNFSQLFVRVCQCCSNKPTNCKQSTTWLILLFWQTRLLNGSVWATTSFVKFFAHPTFCFWHHWHGYVHICVG